MNRLRIIASSVGLVAALIQPALAQTPTSSQAPVRDPQALAVLQQSILNMGTAAPGDSTATGTITTIAGSLTENGTITIMTRGSDQTFEQIQTPHGSTIVYSQGQASRLENSSPVALPMERAVTSQCELFPLPLLVGALNSPDVAYKYVGLETLNGATVHHIQLWNSFASIAPLQSIAAFSVRDVWIDSNSSLPVKIFYARRDAGGSAPSFAMEVFFSDYRRISGVLYPFSIQESFNGTPWATIAIQNVALNTGLTDANFPVQ